MRPELKRAVSLVRKGATYKEAATKCGVTRNSVAGACSRAGLITGRPFLSGDGSRTRLACQLYAEGMKVDDIAEKMGLRRGSGVIYTFLYAAGVKPNRNKSRRKPAR